MFHLSAADLFKKIKKKSKITRFITKKLNKVNSIHTGILIGVKGLTRTVKGEN